MVFLNRLFVSVALITTAFAANATQISSQTQLSSILGSNEIFENFEGNGLLGSGQIYSNAGFLNSTSTYAGYGPGLVKAGATYSAKDLWWNDNGYYGLNSRSLGDSSAWRGDAITITYSTPVNAFGFDLQAYSGYGTTGTVSVYDTTSTLIGAYAVTAGQFFGWKNASGIGSVVIAADDYLMIDNHGFGVAAAVPEAESYAMLLAGLGLVGFVARRRKHA